MGIVSQLKSIKLRADTSIGKILLQGSLGSRERAFADLRLAITNRKPFAMAKVGWIESKAVVLVEGDRVGQALADEMLIGPGIFPATPDSVKAWEQRFVDALRTVDVVALPTTSLREVGLVKLLGHDKNYVFGRDTEPIGCNPYPAPNFPCYTEVFKDKRILVVNPIASFLVSRANEETYQAVWRERSKWWYPASVDAMDIPSGHDSSVREKLGDSTKLISVVLEELRKREFDVALIGAGGYGMEICAEAKRMGKVGILLGGMLQTVFGVSGKRWLDRDDFKPIINDAWVRPPESARPDGAGKVEGGCYW